MRKFILIDQSIKDAGGHHLEYALRVLKAAKNDGFTAVLAVNKSCKDLNSPFIDIVEKAFSYGFWENFTCEKKSLSKAGTSLLSKLIEKKDDIVYDILFSQPGFAYQLLSEGVTASGLVRRYYLAGKDQKIPLWAIITGVALLKLQNWHRRLMHSLAPVLNGASKTTRFFGRLFKLFAGIAIAPVLLVYFVLRWRKIAGRFDHFSTVFGSECRHLLARLNVCDGDIVFVPTLGGVELLGVALCSQKKSFSGLEWHLLFRRNLFQGREPNYLSEMHTIKSEHLELSEFKQRFTYGNVTFYTDTDPLSEQYNILGVYPFHTLPIPHDEALKKVIGKSSPLIITYIGDARDEKGFQHLAQLVCDIRSAGFIKEKVFFRFQSNFNVPLGEAGSRIAKAELSIMDNNGVELIEGPFDSEEYTGLVNNADILLVPYDENNYYARSSGVFAEALAAGVPVIYPAKSWMGRVLLNENLDYWESLEISCPASIWNNLLTPVSDKSKLIINSSLRNPLIFIRYLLATEQPGCFVKLSIYESVQSKSTNGKKEENLELVGTILLDLHAKSGMAMHRFDKSGNYTIAIEYCNSLNQGAFNNNPLFNFTNIEYRLTDSPNILPLQSVGYGYNAIEDLSAGVVELISHYASYERRCVAFSSQWSEYHSASNLVRILSVGGDVK